jgi:periplasmic divalent cation tolerance protein
VETTPPDIVLVVVTHPAEGAAAMARELVEKRLAACVQRAPVASIYRWQGAIESASEVRLECKTTRSRSEACVAAIRARHPYEVPEILVIAVERAHPAYARWVIDETSA